MLSATPCLGGGLWRHLRKLKAPCEAAESFAEVGWASPNEQSALRRFRAAIGSWVGKLE